MTARQKRGDSHQRRGILVLGAFLCALTQAVSIDAIAGTRKFAIVMGNNEGHDSEATLRYAEKDASKFHNLLLELGGFRSQNTKLLLGATAEQAWKTIRKMEKRAASLSHKSKQKSLFMIYYSGHASGDVLELGNTTIRFEELLAFLKKSSAQVRLGFIDSCRSGKLVSYRGGAPGPEFDIHVTDEISSTGYAIITSSAENELSQESAEIRGAYFTHYLISAMRGAGDESGDGKVTLTEAYSYVYGKTLARTTATIVGSQHPMYEFQLEGRGDVILTITDDADSRISLRSPEAGRLVVLDAVNDAIVAEASLEENQAVNLAVLPGKYLAYLVTGDNKVRSAVAEVEAGREATVEATDFQTINLSSGVSRGGLFLKDEPVYYHRLGVGGLWRLWALEGAVSSFGASAHYRLQTPSGIEPSFRLSWSSRKDIGLSTGYNDLGSLLGLGYLVSWRWFAIRAGVQAGYEFMFQNRSDALYYTSAFSYQGTFGVEMPIGPLIALLDCGVGARVFELVEEGWVHRLDIQAVLSLGWKWSQG